MSSIPRFSIVLPVRNAEKILPDALTALERQSHQDFDLVVVDGQSTDGTLDLLAKASSKFSIKLVSEPDRNLADALAKGLHRASADIVAISAADERFHPDALSNALAWFEADPDAVVCCGRTDLIDSSGMVRRGYSNSSFDVTSHLSCEIVLPISACFFNRAKLGGDFRYDSSRPSCPDYEFWGRLGFTYPRESFKLFDTQVATALATRDSMSFRAESFEGFVRDKTAHLESLLARFVRRGDRDALRKRCIAGIHMWAAEQLLSIDAGYSRIVEHCAEAARNWPSYGRISALLDQSNFASFNPNTGVVTPMRWEPGPNAIVLKFEPTFAASPEWTGAKVLSNDPLTIQTSDHSWGYSAVGCGPFPSEMKGDLWLRLELEVQTGSVGVARLSEEKLLGERVVNSDQGRVTILVPLAEGPSTKIMLRSGPQGGSVVTVHSSELLLDQSSSADQVSSSER